MSAVLPTRPAPGRPLRQRLLWAALATSVGLSAWLAFSGDEDAAAPPGARPRLKALAAASAPAATSNWPPPRKDEDGREAWPEPAPLALAAWGLEAAPAPGAHKPAKAEPPPPPPPPQAPPLNYTLAGQMNDGKPRAIFSNALRTEVLGVGEVLDRQWRIEAIDPQGVRLSWLRGDQKKTLAYPSYPTP